jgi:hypothetical protein
MKSVSFVLAAFVFFVGFLTGWKSAKEGSVVTVSCDDGSALTERVEMVHFRTRLRHSACPSNGFWEVSGRPAAIEGDLFDGRTRHLWPHRCDRCGATNTLFDARYPLVKGEWRAVK